MRSLSFALCCLISSISSFGQIVGRWTTIDDSSGEPRSVVEITARGDKFFGKVAKIHTKPSEDPDPICDKCDKSDPRFNRKVIGMEILQDLTKSGNEFSGGHILDPENGKVYRCKLWVEEGDLKVRGYWGPFFRTQTWKRESVQP